MKDRRYNTVKKLILANALGSFTEIFDTVPKTVIAHDLGMHHQTFNKMLDNLCKFTFERAFDIAELVEADPMTIVDLLAKEINLGIKGKKKR